MRKILTEKTDIWALGCILYAICFLAHPFQDGSTLSILNAKIVFPANSPFSADMHTFILRMLDVRNWLLLMFTLSLFLYESNKCDSLSTRNSVQQHT